MGVKAIDVYETRDYVSKHDQDKNNPTIFKIGLLDVRIKNIIMDDTTSFQVSSINPDDQARVTLNINQRNYDLVRFGVKDIINLQDPKTNQPIKFEIISVNKGGKNYNVVSDVIMNQLPGSIVAELGNEIAKELQLSGEEEKN